MGVAWVHSGSAFWALTGGFVSSDHRTTRGGRPRTNSETTERFDATDGFDEWLNRNLCHLYGPVLHEPIPEDLIDLIKTHREDE